jgi:UDP-glucose 4-epimerase
MLQTVRSSGRECAAALIYTCNGRGTRLFPEPHHDAQAVREALGDVPVAGLFAAGELGPVAGKNFVHGFTASIFRLSNIIGARSYHGVIRDLVERLERKPEELMVYGDGTQRKPFLLAEECVQALVTGYGAQTKRLDVFNVGPEDFTDIAKVVKTILEVLGTDNMKIAYTGLSWPGDLEQMWLDISKLRDLGWKPLHNSIESVRTTAKRMRGRERQD